MSDEPKIWINVRLRTETHDRLKEWGAKDESYEAIITKLLDMLEGAPLVKKKKG